MSHLLEEYAKSLGVYISKPIVSKHYFPICENKYITIHLEDDIQSKKYKYYHIVLSLLKPFLIEQNIKVFQIDCKSEYIDNIDKGLSNLTFRQYAYIISKSILHIGSDNIYSHYASSQNVPIINIFGNVYPSVSNGYWSKKHEKIDICPEWKVKPCLSLNDPNEEINNIKPEEIAQSVLTLLKQNKKINFKTIHIGKLFNNKIIEVVPLKNFNNSLNKNQTIFIRADYGFDENIFLQYCKNYKVAIICDKLIQYSALSLIKNNIEKLSFLIDRNTEDIPDRYMEILKEFKINFEILVKNEEDLSLIRNKYFDQQVNLYKINKNKPDFIKPNLKFFSNKLLIEGHNSYASKAHWLINEKIIDKNMNILDTLEYWNELEHFYIYE
jgi:hypothetical protein